MKKSVMAVVFMAAGVTFASAQTTEKTKANDAKKAKVEAAAEVKAATPQLQEAKAETTVEKAAVRQEKAAELKATEVKQPETRAKVQVQ